MKKIFTLIAVAAMAISANAQGIVWAFGENPNAAPVISDENIASGSVTISGQDETYQDGAGYRVQTPSAGNNSGIPFITFQPLDADAGVTVEWTANIASGKTATVNNIALNMARFGTDGGNVDVSYQIDGGEAIVLGEGLFPARNNKAQADDAKGEEEKYTADYSQRIRGAAAASTSIKVIAHFYGLATNKQIGYAQIAIKTGDETPTGIQNVKVAAENAPMYNLAGQKVAEGYKGVVIQNGRKVIK